LVNGAVLRPQCNLAALGNVVVMTLGVGVGVGRGPESQDLMAPTPFQKFDSRGQILSFKGLDRSPTQPPEKKGLPRIGGKGYLCQIPNWKPRGIY
jgi:hypothetical protein